MNPTTVVVPVLRHPLVTLEPANDQNVDLLVQWTLDPVAQGPYERVPPACPAELRALFLQSAERQYFLIRRTADGAIPWGVSIIGRGVLAARRRGLTGS